MALRLDGKIALVTGAARGLGAAIARRFRDEGAQVIANDLTLAGAEPTARGVGGTALAADVSDPAAVRALFEEVDRRFGRLDVLVNNAGISGLEGQPETVALMARIMEEQVAQRMAGEPVTTHLDATMHLPDEAWRRMLAVHLDGTFFCTREALKIMSRQGSGVIVNMGSIMATSPRIPGAPAYAAAKAGILGFTRAVATEVVSHGIRVNAIAPGWIATDMTAPLEPMRRAIELMTPMGRFGDADDVAWAAVYLASDEAKYVTGQVLSPNGGWHTGQ
jgi:3-oxoacyl-[acyl-carrier protein] reductase